MRTGGNTREYTSLEHCVQNLNLSPCESLPTLTGDELLRKYGHQTFNKVSDFIGRVLKEKAKGTSMKKAVQHTLIDFTKPTLIKEGILEYNFSHPQPSDTEHEHEETKDNSDKGVSNKNPGSNFAPCSRGGRPRAYPNTSETKALVRRKKDQISHLHSVKEGILTTPEEGPVNQHLHIPPKFLHHSQGLFSYHSRLRHHSQDRYKGGSPLPRDTTCWNFRQSVRASLTNTVPIVQAPMMGEG